MNYKCTKGWLATLALSLVLLSARAQTDTLEVSFDHLFSQLDKSRISSGYLLDYAGYLPPLERTVQLGGENEPDAKGDKYYFQEVYKHFRRACIHAPDSLPTLNQFKNVYRTKITGEDPIPLAVLDMDFHFLRDSALVDSALLVVNDTLLTDYDTTKSPYRQGHLLQAYLGMEVPVGQASFSIPSSLYLSNQAAPQAMQIDLGDGQGFQEIDLDETVSASYGEPTADYDGSTAIISLKVQRNGQWKVTRFKAVIVNCGINPAPTPSLAPWNSNPNQFSNGNITATYTEHGPWNTGNAYIHYRDNPANGEENLFKRPVIIVEGIDFGDYNVKHAQNYRMGEFGWCELWGNGGEGELNFTRHMPALLDDLHQQDYDIIMLDFKEGAADIRENAYLLAALIEKVNQYKTADAEPNVVIGASMGGIVARYALAWMEQQEQEHCTRLYMSFDSPQQGAYISLGTQYFLKFFGTQLGQHNSEAVKASYESLGQPAARQLLRYNATIQSGSVTSLSPDFLAFQAQQNSIGYPQQTRNVAVASGSGIADPQPGFNAGDELLAFGVFGTVNEIGHYRGGTFAGGADVNMYANYHSLPGDAAQGYRVFEGNVGINPFVKLLFGKWYNNLTGKKLQKYQTYHGAAGMPPLDRVPGGQRALTKEIEDALNQPGTLPLPLNYLNNTADLQSFIPTVSALDINASDWFYHVKNNIDEGYPSNNLTPFDAIYSPRDNTLHVEITNDLNASGGSDPDGDNSKFAKEQIISGAAISQTVLSSTYNYGASGNNYITHETVQNGGRLHTNANLPDGFGSGLTPPQGVTQYYTLGGNCREVTLTIGTNGQMLLGDGTTGNKAIVSVPAGSALRLQNSGLLKINDGSALIVEEGGRLIMEEDGLIELSGSNSILEIQGKLVVGDDADFTFSGNGHVVFNQAVPSGSSGPDLTNYMDIGNGATFTLQGPVTDDNNHLLMEIHKPLYLRDENSNFFSQLTLEDGTIAIKGGALLYNYSPVTMTHMKFTNISGTGDHGGYRMWSNSGINTIEHNEFEHGNPGFMMQWIGGGATPRVRYNNFHDNQVGFHAVGGNFWITDCDFNTNYDGVRGENLSGTSKIIGNDFNGGGVSLEEAQSGSFVYVTDNLIENSSYGLNIYGANTEVRASCNVFQGNSNPVLMQYGALHMNNEAGNQFLNNSSGQEIHVIGEDDSSTPQVALYMKDGYNTFVNPGQSCSPAYVKFDWDFTTERTTSNELDWNNNQLPVCDPGVTNTTGFYVPVQGGYGHYTTFPVYIPNNLTNPHLSACDNFASPPDHPYIGLLQYINNNGGLIGGDPNDPLKGGVVNGLQDISHGETVNEDLTALGTLTGVLNASISNTDAHTDYIRDVALKGLMQSLNNAYEHEELTHNEGDPEGTVVEEMQDVIDILDDFIMDLGEIDSTNAFSYFRYHLDKVHAYRVGGYYAEALSILSSSSSWTFNYTQQMRVSYWDCICTAENDYYTGELSAEGLASAVSGCNETYQGYNYKRQPEEVTAKVEAPVEIFEFYPQPVKERLKLYIQPRPDRTVSYRIFNISGNLIRKGEINWSADEQEIDVSSLPLGMYVTVLEAGTRTERFKFVKE